MEEKQYIEIDLLKLAEALWRKIWLIGIVTVLCAALGFSFARFYLTPMYQANTLLYVNNSDISVGNTKVTLSASDLSAAQSLVDTYSVILKSRATLNEIARIAGVQYSYEQLFEMVQASSVNDTEIFRVVVTSENPAEAERIANVAAKVLPERIAGIVDGSSVRIVDYAVEPSHRYTPSYSKYTAIGGVLGLAIMCVYILIQEMLDKEIHDEEYLMRTYSKIPVLAVIPKMDSESGEGYGYYQSSREGEAE